MKKVVLALALAAGTIGVVAPAMAETVYVVRPHHYYRPYHPRPVVVVRPYHHWGHREVICTYRHHARYCRTIWVR